MRIHPFIKFLIVFSLLLIPCLLHAQGIVCDSFTDTAGTHLGIDGTSGHQADTGQYWGQGWAYGSYFNYYVGFKIDATGTKMYNEGGYPNNIQECFLDSGYATNITIQAVVGNPGTYTGINFRGSGQGWGYNWMFADWYGTFSLFNYGGGQVASSSISPSDGDIWKIILMGDDIHCLIYHSGSWISVIDYTSSDHDTLTYQGFTWYPGANSSETFDNYQVYRGDSVPSCPPAANTNTYTSTPMVPTSTSTSTPTPTATFSFTPTFTVQPCGTSLLDTFAGVNGTPLTSHIANTGQQWYNVLDPGFPSSATLLNNTLICTGSSTDGINVFSKDGDIQVTISSLNSDNFQKLIFRASPSPSYEIWEWWYHEGQYVIYGPSIFKVLANVPAENDILEVRMAGQSLIYLINGVVVDTETDAVSPAYATWVYMDFDGSDAPYTAFSNLSVTNWQGCTPTTTPTNTNTQTATQTATNTATCTATCTATPTIPTRTPVPTTPTPIIVFTQTSSSTFTITLTRTSSQTPTSTKTPVVIVINTATKTITPYPTPANVLFWIADFQSGKDPINDQGSSRSLNPATAVISYDHFNDHDTGTGYSCRVTTYGTGTVDLALTSGLTTDWSGGTGITFWYKGLNGWETLRACIIDGYGNERRSPIVSVSTGWSSFSFTFASDFTDCCGGYAPYSFYTSIREIWFEYTGSNTTLWIDTVAVTH